MTEQTELRTIRIKNSMTMREVGDRVGVSEGAISYYETGKRKLPIHIAKELGKIYGVEWSTLYEDDKGN